jgi:hypothetical protein
VCHSSVQFVFASQSAVPPTVPTDLSSLIPRSLNEELFQFFRQPNGITLKPCLYAASLFSVACRALLVRPAWLDLSSIVI